MSSRRFEWAPRRVAAATACLVGIFGGCGNTHLVSAVESNKGKSMPTMAEGREQVIQATQEVFSSLASLDLQPWLAQGTYSGCAEPTIAGHLGWRDDAGTWRYSAEGRSDMPEGRVGDVNLAGQIRDALVADGWKPLSGQFESVDGIQVTRSGDRWIVRADRHGLSVSINCYADRPYVLVGVLGPCVPTTREQWQAYRIAKPDRIDVGGGGEP